jgi:hypothetical protein
MSTRQVGRRFPPTAAMNEAAPAGRTVAQEKFDDFFNRALAAQSRAETLAGVSIRRRFRLGSIDVEFRLAHPALEPLFCDALAHIEIAASGEPDFGFHIWDESLSGVEAPPPCWSRDDLLAYGEIPAFIDTERYLHVDLDRATVAAGNRRLRSAIVWIRSPDHLAACERAAPLPILLNWLASEAGYFTVHAASVGRAEGGVLVVGRSGAGKSHTAIACLDSDLLYVADDRCLLGTSGRPASASLYSTARLYASDVPRFPILQGNMEHTMQNQDGKTVFFLNAIVPERLSRGFPIKAVVLPQPSGRRDTQIITALAGSALLLLGPESALRSPSVGRVSLGRLASTLRSIPCFRLETGTDMSQIPRTISALLDSLPEPDTTELA